MIRLFHWLYNSGMAETGCKAKGLETKQNQKPEKKNNGKTEEKQGNASIDTVKQTC